MNESLALVIDMASYLGLFLSLLLAAYQRGIRKNNQEALWFLCWAIFFSVRIG